MRIAIASSGLGHVARGIETWALDTAVALHERGVDVTLFAAGEVKVSHRAHRVHRGDGNAQSPHSVSSVNSVRDLEVIVLHSLRRSDALAKRLARMAPGFAWRWGFKSDYGWEQFSFWWKLWPRLKQGGYDILHVQDPMLAYWCRTLRRMGLLQTKEILAHGTEESVKFLEKFDYVQHLAPWHLREALEALRETGRTDERARDYRLPTTRLCPLDKARGFRRRSPVFARSSELHRRKPSYGGRDGGQADYRLPTTDHAISESSNPRILESTKHPCWTAIPNFVDTERFAPAKGQEARGRGEGIEDEEGSGAYPLPLSSLREKLGIPPDAFVVGTVAAVKKPHKRIDYLIREFARFANRERQLPVVSSQLRGVDESTSPRIPESSNQRINACLPFLLICGARTDESDELVRLAEDLCPGRVKFFFDVSREDMPGIYRAMDIFVLPSLFEMMPIALLEALASGLPVVVHEHPVLEWITGARGKGQEERGKGQGARAESRGQTTDCGQQTTDCGQQTTRLRPLDKARGYGGQADYRLQTTDDRPPCFAPSTKLGATQGKQTTDNQAETVRAPSGIPNSPITESSSDQGTTDHRPPTTDHGKENTCASGGDYSPFPPKADPRLADTIHYSQSACREAAGAAIDMSRDGELAGFLAGLTQSWMQESGRAARARAETLFSKDAIIDRYRDYYDRVADDRRDAPMARDDGNRRSSTTNAQHRTSNIEHRTPDIQQPTSNREPRTPNQEPRTKNQEPTRIVAFTKDWDDVPTCTTHVLREMAKTMPVLWVNSIGTRRPSPGHSGDVGRAMKRLTRAFKGAERKETNLRVLSPLLVPKAQSAVALWLNRLLFAAQTRLELRRMGGGPLEYWCFVPNAVDLLPRDKGRETRDEGRGARDEGRGARGEGEGGTTPNIEHRTSNIEHLTTNNQHPTPNADCRLQTTLLRPLDKARGYAGQADDGLQTTAAFAQCSAKKELRWSGTTDNGQLTTDPADHRISDPLVVYYCVDDWSRFENLDTAWISGKEREMILRADVIFTPSRYLEEKCRAQMAEDRRQTTDNSRLRPLDKARGYGGQGLQTTDSGDHSLFTIHHSHPVCHMPHGVQYEMFAAALDEKTQIPADIVNLPRPVIGFYGNIYPWIDFKLVESLAKARPAWSFVMIGQVYCDVSPIANLPNVFLLGRREHATLPSYCKAFAAAMIPYDMKHPRMQSVNPVKLLELLSAGVPVVSADLPDVAYQMADSSGQRAEDRRQTTAAFAPSTELGASAVALPSSLAAESCTDASRAMADETAGRPTTRLRPLDNARGYGGQADDGGQGGQKTAAVADVIMCSTPDEWLVALEQQVARTDRREISRRVAGNDWSDRVRMMRGIVDSERMFPTNHTNLHE